GECAGRGEIGVGIAYGSALIPSRDHGVVETVGLQPAVVAAPLVPRRRDHTQRATVEAHHDGRGVDVAVLGEPGVALHAAGGVHVDDVLPGDPADHVEVMHRAVAEDAAG